MYWDKPLANAERDAPELDNLNPMHISHQSQWLICDGESNNGMHPTANSAAFVENLLLITACAAGDAGRSAAR
jgi:hypothetical protein